MKRSRFNEVTWRDTSAHGMGLQKFERGSLRLEGAIITPFGVVYCVAITRGVYGGSKDKWIPVTRFYAAKNRRQFVRTYPRILSYMGAIRCARRFAKEVLG